MNPDDPLEQLKALKAAPQSDPLDELKKLKPRPKIGQMGHPIVDADEGQPQTDDREVLGGIAALGHDIPGVEALQAMAGMRPLNLAKSSDRAQFGDAYRESLDNLKSAEGSANKWVRRFNHLAGGTIAAAATPGKTAAMQGARFGVGEALGNADPVSLKERIDDIPKRAGIDALAGKVMGELGPNLARTAFAKSLGKNVIQRTAAMQGADAVNFGKAKIEGDLAAANPTPQVVSDALNDTDIQPYVKIVRGSGLFKNADDPTILREAHKLMGERERTLGSRIVGSDDYKAGSELERNEIIHGKRKLSDASRSIMPSFAPANLAHAQAEGELDALKSAADATGRIVRGGDVAGRKLESQSGDAFLRDILQMRDSEAKAATQGVMGKLKARTHLSFLGIPKAALNAHRMAPYIRALDEQSGNELPQYLRAAGIAAGSR